MKAKALMLSSCRTNLRVTRQNYAHAKKLLGRANAQKDPFKKSAALSQVNKTRAALQRAIRITEEALAI